MNSQVKEILFIYQVMLTQMGVSSLIRQKEFPARRDKSSELLLEG